MSLRRACFFFIVLAFARSSPGAETVQTLNTPRTFPEIKSQTEWRERTHAIREQILVDGGLWPVPKRTPLQAKIFGKIERDGYSVEKVYFQSYPGFYVGGNLYRPLGKGAGPFPGILNTHGHWDHGRLEDTELCSGPGRCINFAKQGMVALAIDMVGYNDTHFGDDSRQANFDQLHHEFASNNPVDSLWSVSLMGLQIWDSVRALDFLASLPDVDAKRLACTGASGGGTQTYMLGAIDGRLAAQAPIVMVSHTMQGGCLCENMPGLRIKYSNMEIAAAAAPRPQILVSDTQDWTKDTMTMEGPALAGVYQLFQSTENLRYVQYDFPHNYNKTSREAVYQWFDHLLLNRPDQPAVEAAFHKEADQDLRVFPDGALPPGAISQAKLTEYLISSHRETLQALNPVNKDALENYRRVIQPAWQRTLQLDWPERVQIRGKAGAPQTDCKSEQLGLFRFGEDEPVKVFRFTPLQMRPMEKPTVVVLASPEGGTPYVDDAGAPRGAARMFLDAGFAVAVAADAGEKANPDQTSLLFTTYNRTRLQERVRDLISICQAVRVVNTNRCHVALYGSGAVGYWSMLAAPAADAVITDCGRLDLSKDDALLAPDLFCPGIRNIDTFEGALVLAAPHPLLLLNTDSGFRAPHVQSAYKTLGGEKNLQFDSGAGGDKEVVSWVSALKF